MLDNVRCGAVDAILLAGSDPGRTGFNGTAKYLTEFGGRSSLNLVMDALDGAKTVERIICVGPVDVLKVGVCGRSKGYHIVKQKGSLWDNVSVGVERQQQLGGGNNVFTVCSDLPFLTSRSIDWMVSRSLASPNLQIPVVSNMTVRQLLPTYETYFWPMREYSFKQGNNLLLNVGFLESDRIHSLVDEYREAGSDNYIHMFAKRLALLKKYGEFDAVYMMMINFASKFLQMRGVNGEKVPFLGLRSRRDYEKVMSGILGTQANLLQVPFVEIALDIDNPSRTGIFQRGYDRIKKVVDSQKG